jgi:hypothetical protein
MAMRSMGHMKRSKACPTNVAQRWREFTAAVGDRLAKGQRAYGDASLRARPAVLARELEEELLDVAGWGFLLWLRVRALGGRFRSRLPEQAPPRPARRRRGIVRGRP